MTTPIPTPIDDGGLAFPAAIIARQADGEIMSGHDFNVGGMTLRDHFAAQETLSDFDTSETSIALCVSEALAGYSVPVRVVGSRAYALKWAAWNAKWRATLRYIRADAMIAARKEAL